MIISTDIEKAFDKTQFSFMLKTLTKVGTEEIFKNNKMLNKSIYDKSIVNQILNSEQLKVFPLNSRTSQGHLTHHFYSSLYQKF